MKYKIEGDVMQILSLELDEGEEVFSESGAMAWMSANMGMESYMRGGLGAGIGRMFTGKSLFMVRFKSKIGRAHV